MFKIGGRRHVQIDPFLRDRWDTWAMQVAIAVAVALWIYSLVFELT